MGGVAGHAGLFTTADDMAKYRRNDALGMGSRGDVHFILAADRYASLLRPLRRPISRFCAGWSWDIDSTFSSNRGELYPIGSYGHTGFTGTSVWMDPSTNSFVILLTNVVHPKRGKSLSSLRSRVATVVAASVGIDAPGVLINGLQRNARRPADG